MLCTILYKVQIRYYCNIFPSTRRNGIDLPALQFDLSRFRIGLE